MFQPPPYRMNTELVVKFVPSRDGTAMAYIDGKVSFPARRNTQTAQIGQRWLVEVTGTNPKGTVYFLRLIERCVYNPRPDGRRKLWFEPRYAPDSGLAELEGPSPNYDHFLEPTFYHPALEGRDRQEDYDLLDWEELGVGPEDLDPLGCPDGSESYVVYESVEYAGMRNLRDEWFTTRRGGFDRYTGHNAPRRRPYRPRNKKR